MERERPAAERHNARAVAERRRGAARSLRHRLPGARPQQGGLPLQRHAARGGVAARRRPVAPPEGHVRAGRPRPAGRHDADRVRPDRALAAHQERLRRHRGNRDHGENGETIAAGDLSVCD